MGSETQINREVPVDAGMTVLNDRLAEATVLNSQITPTSALDAGTVLCGKYVIKNKLDVLTGEAELYICSYNGQEYAAKIYRREAVDRVGIAEKIADIDSKYIARIYDTGIYQGFPVEILPYYRQGSLLGRRFDYSQLKTMIIPCLNEGLRVLHEHDIIHKDLKPSNIMLTEDGRSVAIIDFGISSIKYSEYTVVVTETGMTPAYSAPETFRNLFLKESDYYSLGVTIYELFCGYTPYSNMDPESIEKYLSIQRLPFPDDMPKELQDLISALTYPDLTNRNDKSNPHRRWTYEEVKKWCAGTRQTIPGSGTEVIDRYQINQYAFNGNSYTDIRALTKAFLIHWEKGQTQLFRGIMSSFFSSSNPGIAGECMEAETEANKVKTKPKKDIIYWRFLYRLNPEMNAIYWKDRHYKGLPEFGQKILDSQQGKQRRQQKDNSFYDSFLKNQLLSFYIETRVHKNTDLLEQVKNLELNHKLAKTERARKINLYLTAFLLSGQKIMYLGEAEFHTLEDLSAYMKSLLDESLEDFEKCCRQLIDQDGELDVQLESWLLALGRYKEVERWKESMPAPGTNNQ